jgi:hypothetical protein
VIKKSPQTAGAIFIWWRWPLGLIMAGSEITGFEIIGGLKIDPFCGETLQAAIEPEKPTTPVITTNVEQVDLIKLVNHFSLQGSSTGQAKNLAQHR